MDLSIVWALVLLALTAAAVLGNYPPGPERIARFARRHNLPEDADTAPVRDHLQLTRRWRTAGVVIAFLVSLGFTVSDHGVRLDALPLLAGWLAGALIAEGRRAVSHPAPFVREARPDIVPRWLYRVPLGLAAAAFAATCGALLARHDSVRADVVGPEVVMAWGFGAAGCALVIALAVRFIADHAATGAEPDEVGRALAANSIAAIIAVGTLVVWLCLSGQLAAVRTGYFGAVATALGGVAQLGTVAAVIVAALLVRATWSGSPGRPTSRGTQVRVLGVVVVLLIAATTWIGLAIRWDHPPYSPGVVNPTVTITMTDGEHFDEDAAELGVTGLPRLAMDNVFIGRLDYDVPDGLPTGGRFALVVIDPGASVVAPYVYDDRGNGGWWGTPLHEAPARYPWLSAMSEDVRRGQGSAVDVDADESGPISFGGTFPRESIVDPATLLVALIFIGPGQQIYWAVRVPVTVR